jgi:hypothetical protein
MSRVTSQLSISLDGYVAGPNQSAEDPIGAGGMRLHQWVVGTASWRAQQGLTGGRHDVDAEVADEVMRGIGAFVMGRNMFGPGRGSGMSRGGAGGATTRRTTPRCSSSPTIRASRSSWTAARHSTS